MIKIYQINHCSRVHWLELRNLLANNSLSITTTYWVSFSWLCILKEGNLIRLVLSETETEKSNSRF